VVLSLNPGQVLLKFTCTGVDVDIGVGAGVDVVAVVLLVNTLSVVLFAWTVVPEHITVRIINKKH
jgi:hypothetical protein